MITHNFRQYKAYQDMVKIMEMKMKNANVYRLNIGFSINDSNISSFTGRTAHILFLKNDMLMRMLLLKYPILYQ